MVSWKCETDKLKMEKGGTAELYTKTVPIEDDCELDGKGRDKLLDHEDEGTDDSDVEFPIWSWTSVMPKSE